MFELIIYWSVDPVWIRELLTNVYKSQHIHILCISLSQRLSRRRMQYLTANLHEARQIPGVTDMSKENWRWEIKSVILQLDF